MMVTVISVACRQFKMKNTFPVSLHANVSFDSTLEASICRLVSRFTTGTQITVNQTGVFLGKHVDLLQKSRRLENRHLEKNPITDFSGMSASVTWALFLPSLF